MFICLFCYNILAVISYITIPFCCTPFIYLAYPLFFCSLGSFVCCLPLTACFSCIPCVTPFLFFCSMLPLNLLWWSVVCCYNPAVVIGLACFSLTCFPCIPCSTVPVIFAQFNALCISLCYLSLIGFSMFGEICICVTSCIPCGSCLPVLCFMGLYPCVTIFSICGTVIPFVSSVPCMCIESIMIPVHFIGACCECMCPPLICMDWLCLSPLCLCLIPCSIPLFAVSGGLTVLTLCSPALCLAPCLVVCPLAICPLAVCPLAVCPLAVCPLAVCPLAICPLGVCSLGVCSLAICPLGVCSSGICPLVLGGGCCSSPCLIPLGLCGITPATPALCSVASIPLLGLMETALEGLTNALENSGI